MKTSIYFRVSKLFFLFTFLNLCSLNAQDKAFDIIDHYENYAADAREVVYVHLNKSAYIKGESIGFTAYVLDKKDKKPSKVTTNLYISVEDENKNVLKQKLIKVENGVASNIIELDTSFTSGHYTFKAYTNWMRNFNEQNYFIESIRVIDPKAEEFIETTSIENSIDAQFLPEGGHLLNNVINNVGVVLKDMKGFGIPYAKGTVTDKNNFLVSEFQVNNLGIGKFPLLANIDNTYKINFSYLNKDYSFQLNEKIEPIGITLSLVSHRNKAIVKIITNKESLKHIKKKTYKLTLHNGDKIDAVDIEFNKELSIIKAFKLDEIPSGINVFTLFNENNQPVVERLLFNYNGIDIQKSNDLSAIKSNDSITMKLNFKNINTSQFNNLSVSVLPQETDSYNRHHNIISYTYLQPYVNGTIENAKYYFTDITLEKQLELDNLLITHGWSSYDWNKIFKPNSGLDYAFEQGITLKANINNSKVDMASTYMVHALFAENPRFIDIEDNNRAFTVENVFISESDSLYLSKIESNNKLVPAKLYLQTYPSEIPFLYTNIDVLKPKAKYTIVPNLTNQKISFANLDNVQNLDEVVVKTKLEKIRIRTKELSNHRFGTVKVITQDDRLSFYILEDYLRANRVGVSVDSTGNVNFYSGRGRGAMSVFLDDFPMPNTKMFYRYPLSEIDYIEINRSGIGTGARGNNGAIKLYSLNTSAYKSLYKKTAQKYSLPLAFSTKKKFYVPKYRYYNDDFYKGYGTIDWKPELVTDANGNISVKIAQPEVPITLFIEGIANDGSFIFEEKTISLN